MKMRKAIITLLIVDIILLLALIAMTWVSNDTPHTYDNTHESVTIAETAEEQVNEDNFHARMSCDWDVYDSYLLAKIAMAEAEGEDIEGKAHVIMVVLNRTMDDRFPNSIGDVIFESGQFEPIENGKFNIVEPNEECYKALQMIMVDKWDESQGALYFESCSDPDNWHDENLEYLFTYGNHRFYK